MVALLAAALLTMPIARPQNYAVMVHGAGGGGWEYDKWRPVFEKAGFFVVARDLMPVGGGLAGTQLVDYDRQVVDWGQVRDRRNLVLIGASMGGILALKAAQDLKPDAIILVNSAPPAGIAPAKGRSFPDIVRWANGPIKDTRDAMPDSDEKTIQWAFTRWRDESGAVLRELTSGVPVENPSCPVLVILGDKDTDVPYRLGQKLAKRFGADVQLYHGMSHVGPLMSTRAEEVAGKALEWVQGKLKR